MLASLFTFLAIAQTAFVAVKAAKCVGELESLLDMCNYFVDYGLCFKCLLMEMSMFPILRPFYLHSKRAETAESSNSLKEKRILWES
jgi:hypothetical protein